MLNRNTSERRHFGNRTEFPLLDDHDHVVPFNRSQRPDRRMNNYQVVEVDGEEILLQAYAAHND